MMAAATALMVSVGSMIPARAASSKKMNCSIGLGLARDGADVAVLDLDQGGGRQVADEVAALHRRAIAVEADVASAASVAAAVERLHAALGPVHILVNDAGIAGLVPLREMTEDEWDRMIAVHLKGA